MLYITVIYTCDYQIYVQPLLLLSIVQFVILHSVCLLNTLTILQYKDYNKNHLYIDYCEV